MYMIQIMEELIFHGEKKFSTKEKKHINVDITFVEHNTIKKNQYIEIINIDTSTKIECRMYVLLSSLSEIINNDEIEKKKIEGDNSIFRCKYIHIYFSYMYECIHIETDMCI
jgi:hypothetical protein